jgi:V8-like Glu-specific endopeptidase
MVSDEFIQLDNGQERIDRKALEAMAPRRVVISGDFGGEKRQELRQVKGQRVWEIDLPEDAVVGRPGEQAEAVEVPSRAARGESDLDAFLPSNDGVIYHPKVASAEIHEPLRRRGGQIVTPHYVFGADDRQVFFPSGYPWRCAGKVYAWTNPSGGPAWSGAGVLVGSNVVLTASHVVPWGSDPWMMRFIPGYWDGSSVSGVSVASYVQSVRGYRDHDQGDDMAVLKLYTPLGDSLGYFGYKTYNDDWEGGNYWTKVGYPGMVAGGQRPSRVTWYPIIDDDNDGAGVELEYHADSSSGDSGGPVFGWWSSWPYVIGTHSGSEEEYEFPWYINKNNLAAGGSALSSLIGWARSNW